MIQETKIFRALTGIVLSIFVAGCAPVSAQTISRTQLNSAFNIEYGEVEEIQETRIQSQASQGAVTGGMIGGLTSGHSHRGKHALEGAVAGALLTAVLEGKRRAYQYTVALESGGVTKVVTEVGDIREGDCVAVELGQTANIRRVPDVHCQHQQHEALTDPIVHAKRQQEAAECHAAKQQALQATTEEATDIALKKVRVFCEG